mgnify:CR=1 FL=1
MYKKKATPKWLVAWEEGKLPLDGQRLINKCTCIHSVSSLQGRGLFTQFFNRLLLNWSVSETVMINVSSHGHAFQPKFIKIKSNKKRYKGIQVLASRHHGNTLSKNEFVQLLFIFKNKSRSRSKIFVRKTWIETKKKWLSNVIQLKITNCTTVY